MIGPFDPFFDVSRRTIVIGGAPGGIGSEITRLLGERGAWLSLFDSDAERLEEFSDSLDFPHYQVRADITSEADMEGLIAKTEDIYGRVDVVINATGLLPISPALEMSAEDFRQCLDVNISGAFILSTAAAKHMASRGGSIVHIASVSSRVSNPNYAAYASSKAGLSQLVRVLGREWAESRIRVNAIGPALIDTPLTAAYLANEKFYAAAIDAIPIGRLANPQDLLATVLLLCGPGGEFITGQTIYVDGGRTLCG